MRSRSSLVILAVLVAALAATDALAVFSGTDVFLPSVGRKPGAAGSQWYTTVWVYNPNASAVNLTFYLLERDKDNSSASVYNDTLPAGDTRRYDNAIWTMFAKEVFGALRVTASQAVIVNSRIYSMGSGETGKDSVGQFFAAIPASFAIASGQSTQILGVYETAPIASSEFRYNFGFVETAGANANVLVTVYDETGTSIGSKAYTLLPYEQRQFRFPDEFPGLSTTNARLQAEVTSGSGKAVVFGSGIGNVSNDPSTFEMSFRDDLLGGGVATVAHDATLTGNGTASSPLGIANGGVTKSKLSALAGTAGQVLGTTGTTLVWQNAASGGLASVSHDTTLSGDGTSGSPLGLADGSVGTGKLGSGAVTREKIASSAVGANQLADAAVVSSKLGLPISVSSSSNLAAIFLVENTGGSAGIFGKAGSGIGVSGLASGAGIGVQGVGGDGVQGYSGSGRGVFGNSSSGMGVVGNSTSGPAVWGESQSADAIFGRNRGTGAFGVLGAPSTGVYGNKGNTSSAGYFEGNVTVNGALSKASGSFKVDHPLDPANRYLYHSFVESPDMMNVYNGNVTTDESGLAVIQLPDWFEALNRDFRYQLTVIGRFADAIIEEKIANNRFTVRTNLGNVEVSWQVTGIRHDAWANAHRIPVEENKPGVEQGTYLHPELFGQPEEKGLEWSTHPEMMQRMKTEGEKAALPEK